MRLFSLVLRISYNIAPFSFSPSHFPSLLPSLSFFPILLPMKYFPEVHSLVYLCPLALNVRNFSLSEPGLELLCSVQTENMWSPYSLWPWMKTLHLFEGSY